MNLSLLPPPGRPLASSRSGEAGSYLCGIDRPLERAPTYAELIARWSGLLLEDLFGLDDIDFVESKRNAVDKFVFVEYFLRQAGIVSHWRTLI